MLGRIQLDSSLDEGCGPNHGTPSPFARVIRLHHAPWTSLASLPAPNHLQKLLQGSTLSKGAKVEFVRESGGKFSNIELIVASYTPQDASKVQVGLRTQVLLCPARNKDADVLATLCPAKVLMNTSFRLALDKSWEAAFHPSNVPNEVPCVVVMTPSDSSGAREALLDYAMDHSLGTDSVVSISAGRIYADAETMYKGRVDEALRSVVHRAVLARPSVLLFEDLHRLVPAKATEGEETYSSRMAMLFVNLLDTVESQILVVAMARSLDGLAPTVKDRLLALHGSTSVVSLGPRCSRERAS